MITSHLGRDCCAHACVCLYRLLTLTIHACEISIDPLWLAELQRVDEEDHEATRVVKCNAPGDNS